MTSNFYRLGTDLEGGCDEIHVIMIGEKEKKLYLFFL